MPFSCAQNRPMKEIPDSWKRAAIALDAAHPDVSRPSEVAAALDVSSATVTNWRSRGVSKEGALIFQRKLGISATWILEGQQPMLVTGGASQSVEQGRSIMAAVGILTDHVKEVSRGIVTPETVPALAAAINRVVAEIGPEAIMTMAGRDQAAERVGKILREQLGG